MQPVEREVFSFPPQRPVLPQLRRFAFGSPWISVAWFLAAVVAAPAEDQLLHSFKKTTLTDKFWCEGATFGDFNHDGKTDIVSGPYWYEGPDFAKRHEYYPATHTFVRKQPDGSSENLPGFEGALGVNNAYSDNFFSFAYDFNRDGWDDILIIGFPGQQRRRPEQGRGSASGRA